MMPDSQFEIDTHAPLRANDYLVGRYAFQLKEAHAVGSLEGTLLFRLQIQDRWHLVTLVWDQTGHRVYLGNAKIATLFDSLIQSERALSEKEIAAIAESDAPVFAETSVFSFRATPDGLIKADKPSPKEEDA